MLRYCDFIADRIKKSLTASMLDIKEPVQIDGIGKVQWDLGPNGEFVSTKKVLSVMVDGVGYKVTVEEVKG
jgi:hypothetical protein